ncbi:glycoside hydrolase family 19 protein [Oceanospirillum sediminis]|uniref:Glycoside hydrolase family 19 protein n=1 Tax=Oceanospirillum sediminis TaxID=2760088 RepID=A0A839ISX1_9GAMM|nr:glycoside hydrolase family 19 protein [Oceanospirillum sediminis]MBB1487702.1 glycoside hydrolase family 19 protein [Oceanospirillum sediminis]
MEFVSPEQLQKIMPGAKQEHIELYLHGINKACGDFGINTPLRVAHFLAQLAHESGSLRYVSENLNYSAKALRAVFGKYFPTDQEAEAFARQPEKIANRVYADRMGNGDEASGDGWSYRGRGLIQLTGKDNYQRFSQAVGQDAVASPDLLAENPDLAVATAGWYWNSRSLNEYADQDDIKQITRRINGGYNGLEDREEYLVRAKNVLGV